MCGRCFHRSDSLDLVIQHAENKHPNDEIRYRVRQLSQETGRMGYQTKTHPGIVPENYRARGQMISILNGETIAIIEPNFVKKKKVNTPVKDSFAFSSRRQIQFDLDKTVPNIDKQSSIQEQNAEIVDISNNSLVGSESCETSNSFKLDIFSENNQEIGDTSSNIEFGEQGVSTGSLIDDDDDVVDDDPEIDRLC